MQLLIKYTIILSSVWLSQHERILSAQDNLKENSSILEIIPKDTFEFPNHSLLHNLRCSCPPPIYNLESKSENSSEQDWSKVEENMYSITSEKNFQRVRMIINFGLSAASQGNNIVSTVSPTTGILTSIGMVALETKMADFTESLDRDKARILLKNAQNGYFHPQYLSNDHTVLMARNNPLALSNYVQIQNLDKRLIALEQENKYQNERLRVVATTLSKQIVKLGNTSKELSSKQNSLRKRIHDTHKKLEATSVEAKAALNLAHENKKNIDTLSGIVYQRGEARERKQLLNSGFVPHYLRNEDGTKNEDAIAAENARLDYAIELDDFITDYGKVANTVSEAAELANNLGIIDDTAAAEISKGIAVSNELVEAGMLLATSNPLGYLKLANAALGMMNGGMSGADPVQSQLKQIMEMIQQVNKNIIATNRNVTFSRNVILNTLAQDQYKNNSRFNSIDTKLEILSSEINDVVRNQAEILDNVIQLSKDISSIRQDHNRAVNEIFKKLDRIESKVDLTNIISFQNATKEFQAMRNFLKFSNSPFEFSELEDSVQNNTPIFLLLKRLKRSIASNDFENALNALSYHLNLSNPLTEKNDRATELESNVSVAFIIPSKSDTNVKGVKHLDSYITFSKHIYSPALTYSELPESKSISNLYLIPSETIADLLAKAETNNTSNAKFIRNSHLRPEVASKLENALSPKNVLVYGGLLAEFIPFIELYDFEKKRFYMPSEFNEIDSTQNRISAIKYLNALIAIVDCCIVQQTMISGDLLLLDLYKDLPELSRTAKTNNLLTELSSLDFRIKNIDHAQQFYNTRFSNIKESAHQRLKANKRVTKSLEDEIKTLKINYDSELDKFLKKRKAEAIKKDRNADLKKLENNLIENLHREAPEIYRMSLRGLSAESDLKTLKVQAQYYDRELKKESVRDDYYDESRRQLTKVKDDIKDKLEELKAESNDKPNEYAKKILSANRLMQENFALFLVWQRLYERKMTIKDYALALYYPRDASGLKKTIGDLNYFWVSGDNAEKLGCEANWWYLDFGLKDPISKKKVLIPLPEVYEVRNATLSSTPLMPELLQFRQELERLKLLFKTPAELAKAN